MIIRIRELNNMNPNLKEDLIVELTRLLIKTDFYEQEKQVDVYIKKTRVYKDLIKLVKML